MKKCLSFILCICMLAVLVACGGGEGAEESGAEGVGDISIVVPSSMESSASESAPETKESESEAETSVPETAPEESPTETSALPTDPAPTKSTVSSGNLVPEGISRDFFLEGNGFYYHGVNYNAQTGEVSIEKWGGPLKLEQTIANYGGITTKNFGEKVIYLTFDCGYDNGNTAKILDILKDKGVQAIFFCAGDFVDGPGSAALLKRMVDEGHLIGNHTDHHYIMYKQTDETFVNELESLRQKVSNLLGYDYEMHYYRPPQGDSSERDVYLAYQEGYYTTFWSYAYYDYNTSDQPDPAASLLKAEQKMFGGSVYLLHAVSSTNVSILGDLIDNARERGFEIRRIDQ